MIIYTEKAKIQYWLTHLVKIQFDISIDTDFHQIFQPCLGNKSLSNYIKKTKICKIKQKGLRNNLFYNVFKNSTNLLTFEMSFFLRRKQEKI